ncbi:MAG: tRNA lysidine(34) synthetase TilS [Actinomycetota bacterium]|nr:tRNA lysidine(34) synthetase TilS [Actinomycetota bacterium]
MAARPPAVARVLERVVATARRHALFEPGQLVIVAISGGPDSTCLLHALHRVRRLLRIRVAAFHFDHRLRDDSPRDAAYARRQADALGVPFVLRHAEDGPAAGQSVEAWARLARYAAFTSAAIDAGADVAALGHTQDDQAETVLLGVVRGGGIDAVAGMAPRTGLPPLGFPAVRPLLDTTRQDALAFCRSLGLRPREDPTNRQLRFLRNRVRLKVLPQLERVVDRNLRVTLARMAEHVRADADLLEELASEASMETIVVGDDHIRLHAERLLAHPRPIAARVVRHALRLASAVAGGWDPDLGAAHVEGILGLAAGRPRRRLDLPGPLMAVREKEYVALSSASPGASASPRDR